MSKTCEVCDQPIKAFEDYKIHQKSVCGPCADKYFASNDNQVLKKSLEPDMKIDSPIKTGNSISSLLFAIGLVIMVLGFIGGLTIKVGVRYDAIWPITLAVWFGAFVSGMIFIGFSEVIKLLHVIAHK
ncbi:MULTISPECIES: hypothetical protein [unclassified Fusibacter]|uniref:hypothetical protein n=1 Tax=unclassified Fusibacter TaxID=2624464 RepID=UPI0010103242|nr:MULTISPECIES: hypothetical protein [unclassified Fusibacter]MCK8058382.1 hypothetical protein [Fusibacter sp. A2]NPE20965.1 hypothetical protein [Fusibacter sp. A1]RXV63167.1 hypothetical protein DWB64_03945 [Fusibacter sp. A1]